MFAAACGSTCHAARILEKTRRRPALVPAPCPYPPCISRHRPAPVRVIMRPPRGGQPLEGGKGCPPPGHRPRPARARKTLRSSPLFAPRPRRTWVSRTTYRRASSMLSRGIPAPWDTRRHISNHAHDAAMAEAASPDMEELRDPAKTGELRGAAGAGQDRAARRTRAHMPTDPTRCPSHPMS